MTAPTRMTPGDLPPTNAAARALRAGVQLLIGACTVIGVWHAIGYFFLFDDFDLVAESAQSQPGRILATPLFNFYRPVVFLMTRAQTLVVSWDWPWTYAAGSLVIHVLNAWLVTRLASALGLVRDAALIAGALFLTSVWAVEAFYWVSGRFDLLAATGVLWTLLASLQSAEARTWRTVLPATLAAACGTVLALGSKETAVVLPAVVLLIHAREHARAAWRPGAVASIGVVGAITATYLVVRERLLPGLDGMYGSFDTLVTAANWLTNAAHFVLRTVSPPLPVEQGATPLLWLLLGSLVTIVLAASARACWERPRLTAIMAAAYVLFVLPVIWINVELTDAGKSRLLYLPGIWVALTMAIGIERAAQVTGAVRRWAAAAAGLVLTLGLIASLAYQATLWRTASDLSRTAIDDVRRAMPATTVVIRALPWVLTEGPPVLRPGLITKYLGPGAPTVRANYMALSGFGERLAFVRWQSEYDGRAVAPGERLVDYSIPVFGVPTGHVSLTGAVTAPAPDSEVPTPFAISGWAIDRTFATGAGVDTLHVWAHPQQEGAAPQFLGSVEPREASPAAAARYGQRFGRSGFTITVPALAPGRYMFALHPHLVATNAFGPAFTVSVTVR